MKRAFCLALLLLAACKSPPPAAVTGDAAFWKWFDAHKDEVAKIKRADEPIADQLAAELHKISPDLTFEMGIGTTPKELIISAGGIKSVFPTVNRLVAAAPAIPGWKVIALRPRKPMTEIQLGDGKTFAMDDMRVSVSDAGDKLDVTIFVKGRPVDNATKNAVYLLLDCLLGEYDVETRLGGIDIEGAAAPASAKPFKELATLVDAKKK
jgi:hypothetical protein